MVNYPHSFSFEIEANKKLLSIVLTMKEHLKIQIVST